ncbi:hypothetical protein GGR21_003940 [Dysgonomonas hofstadii]|uniref:Uncharacterized protein n=1 Tax=Dysgonomonas hofstadii TaxID=637886 RepID=A0A840CWP0_9BACT|nr:hypothetical protein [Dysgonomonas hofstadii]MBB4038014.1 hypothetical protein [Dysgonomonas hofstadii]
MNSYENKHLKFDTVKIRTNKEYLKETCIEFNKNYNKHGDLLGINYSSKYDKSVPYNLYIGISYPSKSLTLEFSSKILLDDYPKLITQTTFRQCLENINKLGICTIDVDSILNDCYFSKVHITNDIEFNLTDNVLSSLNTCVGNPRRFNWIHYKNEGIRFTKDVKSESCKESIVIYDKEKEIEKSENKKFLSEVENPNTIKNYFEGKTRFEMELNTPKRICEFLNTENTHISNIFKSNVNPLLTQFNKVFRYGEVECKDYINNYETYAMVAIIKKHNGDLKKIHQEMKDLYIYSPNSRNGLADRMKKITALHFQMCNQSYNSNQILSEIRQKLSE